MAGNGDEQDWTISHDFAFTFGGAERVTAEIAAAAPGARVIVTAGNAETLARMGIGSRAQRLERVGVNERNYRLLVPLHLAVARRRVVQGNLLASSYGFAHLIKATGSKIVYCHSPLRQAWSGIEHYSKQMDALGSAMWGGLVAPAYRRVDRAAAHEADRYISTSRAVRDRVREYYGLDSEIVPPPVSRDFSHVRGEGEAPRGDHYLWVGRIVEPYKRLSLVIEAFRRLDRSLVVIGDGRDRNRLEAIAPPNVAFVGEVHGKALAAHYRSARALIFPSEDDFGMVATEAIYSGTPVVAWARGGALDTIRDHVNGILYGEPTVDDLLDAVDQFERTSWDHDLVAASAEQYSAGRFIARMSAIMRGEMST